MIFGGLQKQSLIDYPGKISCVLFVSGCNFRCPYCHNPQLAKGTAVRPDYLTSAWFFDFLEKRREFLDAVVISGGEPTLQQDLFSFCEEIKQLGYAIKIDTNGSQPRILKLLMDASLVDYIAMDIKTDPNAYVPAFTAAIEPDVILWSIRILMASRIAYEFRTTCVKPLVDLQDIEIIARRIQGAERYCLQRAQKTEGVLDATFFEKNDDQYTEEALFRFKTLAARWVKRCILR
jgi:pyruvate formate lyase activating enzyme